MPIDASTIISLQVAARIYGCTVATIRTFVAEGLLPGYRIGPRMIRVKRSDVDALMSPVPTRPQTDATEPNLDDIRRALRVDTMVPVPMGPVPAVARPRPFPTAAPGLPGPE